MESIKQTILTDSKVKIKYFDKKHKIRITLDDDCGANRFFANFIMLYLLEKAGIKYESSDYMSDIHIYVCSFKIDNKEDYVRAKHIIKNFNIWVEYVK
jgi:hypothetical protein